MGNTKFRQLFIQLYFNVLIFSPDSKYFYILYKGESPIKYEIKSGKEILSFKYPEEPINKMICYNFSSDGRTLYLVTKNLFISWNTNDGKLIKIKKEESPIKIIKNDLMLSLSGSTPLPPSKNYQKRWSNQIK